MITKGIAYAFAAAAACLTSYSYAQSVPSAQPPASDTPATTVTTPSFNGADPYRHAPALAILHKRVDFNFSNFTFSKAIELVSLSTGMRAEVDPRLKITAKVSVESQNVPIYRVLEMITHQPGTDCMISPKGNGVILEPWPTLEVNGKKEQFRSLNAPWSDAWDRDAKTGLVAGLAAAPATLMPVNRAVSAFTESATPVQTSSPPVGRGFGGSLGGGGFGGSGGGGGFGGGGAPQETPGGPGLAIPEASVTYPPGITWTPQFSRGESPNDYGNVFAPMASGMGAPGGYGLSGSLSVMVTALSEKSFVVTEPGMGPKNEFGVYLTVYRVEGEKIREVSHVFHRSANGVPPYTAARRGGKGMMPGMAPGVNSPRTAPPMPGSPGRPNGYQNFEPAGPGPGGPGLPPSDPNFGPPAGGPARPGSVNPPIDPAEPPVPAGGTPPGTTPRAPVPPAPGTSVPRGNLTAPADTSSGDVLGGGRKTPEDPFDED